MLPSSFGSDGGSDGSASDDTLVLGGGGGGRMAAVHGSGAFHEVERSAVGAFHEVERRLEQELEAAREREAALQAALRERSEQLSELVVCPITHEPMVDPVSAADGQTYERRAIEEWMRKGPRKGAVPTSPLTGEPLKDTTLRPNFLARALSNGLPAKI